MPLHEAIAGKITELTWHFGAAHVGDCAVFLSYDVSKPLDSMIVAKVPMQPPPLQRPTLLTLLSGSGLAGLPRVSGIWLISTLNSEL